MRTRASLGASVAKRCTERRRFSAQALSAAEVEYGLSIQTDTMDDRRRATWHDRSRAIMGRKNVAPRRLRCSRRSYATNRSFPRRVMTSSAAGSARSGTASICESRTDSPAPHASPTAALSYGSPRRVIPACAWRSVFARSPGRSSDRPGRAPVLRSVRRTGTASQRAVISSQSARQLSDSMRGWGWTTPPETGDGATG
jgi:hypothetical protein